MRTTKPKTPTVYVDIRAAGSKDRETGTFYETTPAEIIRLIRANTIDGKPDDDSRSPRRRVRATAAQP